MKKYSPRIELRRQDNLSRKMPTVARSGDPDRLGNTRIIFDDTKTIIFGASTVLSFPTTLQSGSAYLTQFISSSLFLTSSTKKGITDNKQWITNEDTTVIRPFLEHGLQEQDMKMSEFYISGSKPSELGSLEFTSNLGSKTQIRIRTNVSVPTQMQDTTASLYYFNRVHGIFEEVGQELLQNPATVMAYGTDAKLFNCLGVLYASGSEELVYSGLSATAKGPKYVARSALYESSADAPAETVYNYIEASQFIYTGSALLHPSYSANISQSFNIGSYITEPFLLEKVIIEFPIKAGPGWMNDYTRFSYGAQQDITSGSFNFGTVAARSDYGMVDLGGPAVTVSLLRQTQNGGREVICSGSFIPHTDNTSSLIELYRGSDIVTFNSGSTPPSGTSQMMPLQSVGFNTYSTPNFVVSSSTGFFTGTIRIAAQSEISNGFIGMSRFSSAWWSSYLNLVNMNPDGRGQIGPSARSIFGKEHIKPVIDASLPSSHKKYPELGYGTSPSFFDVLSVNNANVHAYSPYLLFPGDKLVLAISKHRPVKKHAMALGLSTNKTYDELTGSHDIAIEMGELNISLFGSQVREGKEFHNTLNQLFSSEVISEPVGTESGLDQFDTFPAIEYSGSYISHKMSGSMIVKNRFSGSSEYYADYPNNPSDVFMSRETRGERVIQVNTVSGSGDFISSTGLYSERFYRKYEHAGFNRFTQATSPNERYFDSMLPKMDAIASVDGAKIVKYIGPDDVVVAMIILDFMVDGADFSLAQWSNNRWSKSFPFEPKYSAINRDLRPAESLKATALWDNVGSVFTTISGENVHMPMVLHQYNSGALEIPAGVPNTESYPGFLIYLDKSTGSTSIATAKREAARAVYGIGNLNTVYKYSDTGFAGSTHMPSPRALTDPISFNLLGPTIAEIRGWKYGIYNGLEQLSKSTYRHNRYGQFRDRLEQRLDGKFYETVGYTTDGIIGGVQGVLPAPVQSKFFDSNGSIVKPENTTSSNISFECTSSLPYFDGEVRNREEPINASDLSSTIITL